MHNDIDQKNPETTFEVSRYGEINSNFEVLPEAYMLTILGIAIPAFGALIYKKGDRFYKSRSYKNRSIQYENRYNKIIEGSNSIYKNKEQYLEYLAEIRTQPK